MSKSDIKGTTIKQRNEIKKACLENSKWLLMQAREQFRLENYNLSTFLAITAYEESLKYGLLNSHESKLLTDKEYNLISSWHIGKLLSKHAFIQISVDNKKLKQEYTLPRSDYFKKIVKEITEKREKALYVDFINLELNIPTKMGPEDAMEEITRAYKSINDETLMELITNRWKKNIKEIKNQKIVKPKLTTVKSRK